ncbi:quercetin 2,3-dioxygenase [uncultured Amnibacterium sp.]|uniref:quercetin 2,3-dioxygenase n=1 Tax=uncultured Amnibacterium sp. TaxID=1631851 RepID=UPI0035CBBCBA
MSLDTHPKVDESAERDRFPGILPGKPAPFVLRQGEGEKSVLFGDLFTILLSGDETEGQYDVFTAEGHAGEIIPAHLHRWTHEIFYIVDGTVHVWMDDEHGVKEDRLLHAGDFAYVPKDVVHAYRYEATSKVLGTSTAGFGRFFHAMGKQTDKPGIPDRSEIFVPTREQMQAAGEKYGTVFRPEFRFDAAE